MIISRLTRRAQTTVPQAVRAALRLQPGDEIAYTIEAGGVVIMRRPTAEGQDEPFALFEEWGGDADREAYGGL